jgi:hypothetical protein
MERMVTHICPLRLDAVEKIFGSVHMEREHCISFKAVLICLSDLIPKPIPTLDTTLE